MSIYPNALQIKILSFCDTLLKTIASSTGDRVCPRILGLVANSSSSVLAGYHYQQADIRIFNKVSQKSVYIMIVPSNIFPSTAFFIFCKSSPRRIFAVIPAFSANFEATGSIGAASPGVQSAGISFR